MAGRIRTIKPEWLEDERLASQSADTRMLSVALILLADDYGNGRAAVGYLVGQVYAYYSDVVNSSRMARESLANLSRMGFLDLYSVNGQQYYSISNWSRHQKVDRPGKPRVPGPDLGTLQEFADDSRGAREETSNDSRLTSTSTSTDDLICAVSEETSVAPILKKPKPKRTPKYTEAELAVVAVVLEKLSTWAHCTYRPGTESYRKLIVARMRGDNATETELRNVVWHKGNEWEHDEDMSRYLRPSTLFQASKWAEYRDAAMAWASDGEKNDDSENPGRNRRRDGTDDETLWGLWGDNGNPRA